MKLKVYDCYKIILELAVKTYNVYIKTTNLSDSLNDPTEQVGCLSLNYLPDDFYSVSRIPNGSSLG